MGFWLGTLIFAVLEVVGFFTVEAVLGKQYRQEDRRYGKIKNTRYDMNNVDGQLMLVALGIESSLKTVFVRCFQACSDASCNDRDLLLVDVDASLYRSNVSVSIPALVEGVIR